MRAARFAGLAGHLRGRKDKYANCERSKVQSQNIRKLTPQEIDEWYARLERIMNASYVVVEVKMRRAVV